MKFVNFINPHIDEDNRQIYGFLTERAVCGFDFSQVEAELRHFGYVITEKQYQAFETVLNEMMALDFEHEGNNPQGE